jgi:hypothetical protein
LLLEKADAVRNYGFWSPLGLLARGKHSKRRERNDRLRTFERHTQCDHPHPWLWKRQLREINAITCRGRFLMDNRRLALLAEDERHRPGSSGLQGMEISNMRDECRGGAGDKQAMLEENLPTVPPYRHLGSFVFLLFWCRCRTILQAATSNSQEHSDAEDTTEVE